MALEESSHAAQSDGKMREQKLKAEAEAANEKAAAQESKVRRKDG